MADASGEAVDTVLGQRKNGKLTVIHYAIRILNEVQMSYATTEKELLAIVFALEKFWTYLLGYKTTVYTNHIGIRHLLMKKESKSRLMQ